MATRKVTVTLPVEQLDAVRAFVDQGRSKSVSAFVQHAVAVTLGDVAGWGLVLDEALARSGGPLTSGERAWADAVLAPPTRAHAKRKKRRAA